MAIDAYNVHWTCGCHEYVMRQNYWRHSSYVFSQGVSSSVLMMAQFKRGKEGEIHSFIGFVFCIFL